MFRLISRPNEAQQSELALKALDPGEPISIGKASKEFWTLYDQKCGWLRRKIERILIDYDLKDSPAIRKKYPFENAIRPHVESGDVVYMHNQITKKD